MSLRILFGRKWKGGCQYEYPQYNFSELIRGMLQCMSLLCRNVLLQLHSHTLAADLAPEYKC